jgi:hypothetical protein
MLRMQEMTFPGFKFQTFPPPDPLIHAWYIGNTRGLQPLLSPSNILPHRKVPFQKMPPHGKILKKGPDMKPILYLLGFSKIISVSDYQFQEFPGNICFSIMLLLFALFTI